MATLAAAGALLVACGTGPAAGPPASTPGAPAVAAPAPHERHDHPAPGPSSARPVQAAASTPADLRVGFESLLGHHATLTTRLMRTVLRGDPDLVEAANQALVLNSQDISGLIAGLHGPQAGEDFEALWVRHNDLLIHYTRAVADGDQAARDAARAGLDAYRAEFGAFVEGATNGSMPAAEAAAALGPHLDHLTGFADAYDAGDLGRAYDVQREAFAHMFPIGRALAAHLSVPPGEPPAGLDEPSQQLRSTLGLLLGEHFELMVDAMRAAVRGSPEFDAAASALDANQSQLTGALDALVGPEQAARFNEAWADHIELLVRYSVAVADGDAAERDRTRVELRSARHHIAESFSALTGGAIPVDAAATALSPHDELLVEQLEAYAAEDYARAHEVAFDGYQHMFDTVAVVAPAIEAHLAAGAPVGPAQTGGGGLSASGSG